MPVLCQYLFAVLRICDLWLGTRFWHNITPHPDYSEEIENAVLFLRLLLYDIITFYFICHENGTFLNDRQTWRIWKRRLVEAGRTTFWKWSQFSKTITSTIITRFSLPSFPQTQIRSDRWCFAFNFLRSSWGYAWSMIMIGPNMHSPRRRKNTLLLLLSQGVSSSGKKRLEKCGPDYLIRIAISFGPLC